MRGWVVKVRRRGMIFDDLSEANLMGTMTTLHKFLPFIVFKLFFTDRTANLGTQEAGFF